LANPKQDLAQMDDSSIGQMMGKKLRNSSTIVIDVWVG